MTSQSGASLREGWLKVRITGRRVEAHEIVSVELRADHPAGLPAFEAGAHVDVDAGSHIRQYSICNDPSERDRYVIAVLLEPNSRGGSLAIHRDFLIGREVWISTPKNHFALAENAARTVLIAGGIGITPLLSMASRLHGLSADFQFYYCFRSEARGAFLDELRTSPFSHKVHLHVDELGQEQRFNFARHVGRIDPLAQIYVCGPEGFIESNLGEAHSLGWSDDRLHVERFSANVELTGSMFEVAAIRSGKSVLVAPEETIAQALRRVGVPVALSCEQGVCGTCITPVIEGTVDHRDCYLSEEEKDTNTQIAICCSRAKSRLLKLDI